MSQRPEFDDRFEVLSGLAHRVAYRLLGNREEAREVAQETLAKAFARWRKVAAYDEPWVARVATNQALDICRRRRPSVPLDDQMWSPGADPASVALQRHGLADCLRKLSRRQREVVVLRYLADLPEREVADLLHTTVGSVKQHAHRAISRLRADMVSPAFAFPEADDV
jgi:RNA polymerase sigma factor (sigma-70 family)